jgi:hypothetical protein
MLPAGLVTGADIRGTVRDASGLVLYDATVVATSLETGITRQARTDREGRYAIMALPPGSYRISAALAVRHQTRNDVAILLGQMVSVDFELAPTARESVVVVPTTPITEVGRTGVSTVIERNQIDSLPINGRTFISFAALTPGVSPTERAIPVAETSGLSFVGQRSRDNNILVDGLDNNDRILGSALASLSQEACASSGPSPPRLAEFGNAVGGVVNIVTKSGTNKHKGELFLFHRNEHLNAKDYLNNSIRSGTRLTAPGAMRHYQWGGTVGGPIRTDRTFYFLSLERLDVEASNFVNIDANAALMLKRAAFLLRSATCPSNSTPRRPLANCPTSGRPAARSRCRATTPP